MPHGKDAGEDGQLAADVNEVRAQGIPLAENAHEHDDGEQQKRQGAALHERLEDDQASPRTPVADPQKYRPTSTMAPR